MYQLKNICIWSLGFLGYHTMVKYASLGVECWVVDHRIKNRNQLQDRIQAIRHNYWNDQIETAPEVENIRLAEIDQIPWEQIQAHFICLPVENIGRKKEADLVECINLLQTKLHFSSNGNPPIIIVESSFAPQTMDNVIIPQLKAQGKELGRDFLLVCSPLSTWYLDPKSTSKGLRLMGGRDSLSLDVGARVLGLVDNIKRVDSFISVELMRAMESSVRLITQSFSSQIATAFANFDLSDVWGHLNEVFPGLKFEPSLSNGGVNYPVSANFLLETSNHSEDLGIIKEAMATEFRLIQVICDRISREGVKQVLILGLSYIKDSRLYLNGPFFKFLDILKARDIDVFIDDPMFSTKELQQISGVEQKRFVELRDTHTDSAVLLLSTHTAFSSLKTGSLREILQSQKIVFDATGAWRHHNLIQYSINYVCLHDAGWA